MNAFYQRLGGQFQSTVSCRGPWDLDHQHGGPPSALMLHEMQRVVAEQCESGFVVTRHTCDFLRPVPMAPLRVEIEGLDGGRRVQRIAARLFAGDTPVMYGRAAFAKQTEGLHYQQLLRPGHEGADESWPAPESLEAGFEFPFFVGDKGYQNAIDIRLIDQPWGSTPTRCWARPVLDLVDGEALSPEAAVVLVADAESGISPPIDPMQWGYPNPDLSVFLGRRPQPGWIGFNIRSRADGIGIGLSESELRDAKGIFGRSLQSLIVAPRI